MGEILPIVARVNHGRWIVDCPACPSASLATSPRPNVPSAVPAFRCPDCGSGPWPTTYPVERATIVDILGRRPDVTTRNWSPCETLDDLEAENIGHGH